MSVLEIICSAYWSIELDRHKPKESSHTSAGRRYSIDGGETRNRHRKAAILTECERQQTAESAKPEEFKVQMVDRRLKTV